MMKSMMAMLVVCCLCVGCNSAASVKKENQHTLSIGGDLIGKLPDGRQIVCYRIQREGLVNPHFIYVVEGSVTTNHRVGKHDSVEAVIDAPFFPKETP